MMTKRSRTIALDDSKTLYKKISDLYFFPSVFLFSISLLAIIDPILCPRQEKRDKRQYVNAAGWSAYRKKSAILMQLILIKQMKRAIRNLTVLRTRINKKPLHIQNNHQPRDPRILKVLQNKP